jgi:hypothetical protein
VINPKAADGIYRTAQRMAEAEKVFDAAIQSAKKRVSMSDGSIEISALKQEPSPEYLLFEMLTPLGFSPDSIEQIATCLDGPTGRYFSSETHELVFDRRTTDYSGTSDNSVGLAYSRARYLYLWSAKIAN